MDMNASASDWDSWDPMKEDHLSSMNTLAIDTKKNPLASITGTLPPIAEKIGNITICERYIKYGDCMDRKYCSKLHIDPKNREQLMALQETYETNKNRTIMNYTYLSPQDIEPNPDALLLTSVTNVISPGSFYIILPYENKDFAQCTNADLKFYIDQVKTSSPAKSKLQDCHNKLSAIFDHDFRIDNVNDPIYPSQIVACKLKDGQFRRAMVIDTPDQDNFYYTLFLIDLGTNIELPRDLIYDIKAHCLSEPPMAIHCRLDLKPSGERLGWDDSTLKIFEIMARGQLYLICSILEYSYQDQIYTVDLKHTATRSSLTDKLLETGLVDKTISTNFKFVSK